MANKIIFADCNVRYEGRASSTLCDGRYLIIIKNDGSLLIHDGNKLKPKNYIGPKAKIEISDDKIVATCKKETITISISKEIINTDLCGWDNNNIAIVRTEFELRDKLADNIVRYLNIVPVRIEKEVATKVGKIDLLVIDENEVHHIIEVKRGTASLSACSQLYRYYIDYGAPRYKGYIAAPKITNSGAKLLEEYGLGFIPIGFEDELSPAEEVS